MEAEADSYDTVLEYDKEVYQELAEHVEVEEKELKQEKSLKKFLVTQPFKKLNVVEKEVTRSVSIMISYGSK